MRLKVVHVRRTVLAIALALAAVAVAAQRPAVDGFADLRHAFLTPPPDSRIMMRWWWFGPSVTKAEIARELETMKAGGIGGVEIQPVYPMEPDSSSIKNLPYLSDEFLDAVRFANDKARELGMRVDITVGSGWPYGGPQVGIDRAASKLRVERVAAAAGARRPAIGPGEKVITELPAGDGSRDTLVFIASRTGQMVKRAGVGAEGYVLDHYDRAALDMYLDKVGERLLTAFGTTPPYAIFCDSLEVYESDWTPDFLKEFAARRGYDLTPHLAALAVDAGPQTAALRHDWGQTLTELVGERFVAPLQDWAHRHQTKLRIQGYGTPPATLSTYAHADLPEGEGPQWRTLSSTRWASSASHVFGRPVTSSETWTWLNSPVFRATPLDMKAEADLHFLQGVNQLVGHGWPYTPESVEYPGWRFYAAAVFDEKNPWWIVMPDVTQYLQRVSFLLRQGTPVNDVAVYLPTADAWARFSPGKVSLIDSLRERIGASIVPQVLDAGFGLDFLDDDALKTVQPYRAIVLPAVERIPLETLQRLETFAQGGGVLIATRRLPALSPGFTATEADHQEIRAIARRLFEAPGAAGHFVPNEETDLGATLGRVLHPDVVLSPATPEVGFVHRRTEDGDVYFIANTGNVRHSASATFRVDTSAAESWNPMTGQTTPLTTERRSGGGTTVSLDLEPYGSRVIVFPVRGAPAPAPRPRTSSARPPSPPAVDLSAGWRVTFQAGAPSVEMDRLRSWTADDATRYFSGVATYERDVVVTPAMIARGRSLALDFGEAQAIPPQRLRSGMRAWLDGPVREAAVVYVNGQRAGSVWSPPYSIDITRLLTPGTNTLQIFVANLALNDMAGHPLPDYKLLNLRYGSRFDAQDMDKVQPIPAGLMGPIRLLTSSP